MCGPDQRNLKATSLKTEGEKNQEDVVVQKVRLRYEVLIRYRTVDDVGADVGSRLAQVTRESRDYTLLQCVARSRPPMNLARRLLGGTMGCRVARVDASAGRESDGRARRWTRCWMQSGCS